MEKDYYKRVINDYIDGKTKIEGEYHQGCSNRWILFSCRENAHG